MKLPESSDEMDESEADGAGTSSSNKSKGKGKRRVVVEESESSSSEDGSGSDGYETWEEDEEADNSEIDEYCRKVRQSGLHVVHLACPAACGLLGVSALIPTVHAHTRTPTQERKKKAREQRKSRGCGRYERLEDGTWGYVEPERK